MNCEEIIERMRSMSSEKYRANVVKMGIPEDCSLGVSTGDVRQLARELKGVEQPNELASQLWHSGYHEAKLLAALLFQKTTMTLKDCELLMNDVTSWDLCDHLCKNLIMKIKGYESLIEKWCMSDQTYFRRGAFTLMALAAIHEKDISQEAIDAYLDLIRRCSEDLREHVKKAVSWALREIGKKDFDCQEKAVLLAHELAENGSRAQAWIGKDALKELEKLVRVEGRGRLISEDSKMGMIKR